MWKSLAVSLFALSATISFADTRKIRPIKFKPLCNGHAGSCIPGEPEDPLYKGQMGASGKDMNPEVRIAPKKTPVGEVLKQPGFFDGITSWANDIAKRFKNFEVSGSPYIKYKDHRRKIEMGTGPIKAGIEMYPPDEPIPPSATPMSQPGANFVDSNGKIFLHIEPNEPVEKLYYAMSKFMNKDSWNKPFVDTDGALLMINGYGSYCYMPNYELNQILRLPRVIMTRKAELTGLTSTGQCEYPNKTGYVYNHGLWVKVNSDTYCETGWDWFNAQGWEWHELPDDSFMVNGFKKLNNGGDCAKWF